MADMEQLPVGKIPASIIDPNHVSFNEVLHGIVFDPDDIPQGISMSHPLAPKPGGFVAYTEHGPAAQALPT